MSGTSDTSASTSSPWGLRDADLEQLADRGIATGEALNQLRRLRRGSRHLVLDRPATLGDGIEILDPEGAAERFEAFQRGLERCTRFIPASGAATRMFRDLLARLEQAGSGGAICDRGSFFDHPWPFRSRLEQAMTAGSTPPEVVRHLLLGDDGLARRPKALLPFHLEGDTERTAFEEQVLEALELARMGDADRVRLHFTVSPEHRADLEALARRCVDELAGGIELSIGFSEQHPATDTLALGAGECPAREGAENGPLLLRPGGHGALLSNLQELDADLVLVKNIDNVQPASSRSTTLNWKAALLGALVLAQEQVFDVLDALSTPGPGTVRRARSVLRRFGREVDTSDAHELRRELHRPIRLCGVVANRGEPGGGPFWVDGRDGRTSLQIVEAVQVDPDADGQQAILRRATHFNPVDLACAVRDRDGRAFDLERFRDEEAYFVASKSHAGRPIRALEHPGLWNGAMAHWLTVFVEAPSRTFTPVKTVWDLLRPEHQPAGDR